MKRATRRALPGGNEALAPVIHVHAWSAVVVAAPAASVLVGVTVGASVVIAVVMIAVVVGSVASSTVLQWRKRGGYVSRHTI